MPNITISRPIPAFVCVWSALLVLMLATGCSAPPTPEQIEESAKTGASAAREGCVAKDVKTAEKGARQTEKALRDAQKRVERLAKELKEKGEPDSPDLQEAGGVLERVKPLARDARLWADLAAEEKRCADTLKSLKASAYRTARKCAVLAIFHGLALASDQMAKKKPDELPKQAEGLAKLACDLAGCYGKRPPLPDGTPDWPGIAEDMRAFSKTPPPELGLILAVGFLVSKQPSLALVELADLPPETFDSIERKVACRCLKGLAYRTSDCRRMAAREFEQLKASEGAELGKTSGPEIEAGLYMLVCCYYLSEKNMTDADQWLMRAGQACPNNPLTVFLTGERMAATGEWEKAADSLEARAKTEEDKWVSEVIAKRARQIRDQKGDAPPLIMDAAFLWEISSGYLKRCAAKTEPAKKLQEQLDAGKGMAKELLSKIPGMGGTAEQTASNHPEAKSAP